MKSQKGGRICAHLLKFGKIYANPITESVELLPIVLYNDGVEFDNTLFSIWRYGYVY